MGIFDDFSVHFRLIIPSISHLSQRASPWKRSRGEKTIAQIASESGVHPNQIRQWRQHLLDVLPEAFSNRRPQEEKARDDVEAELYRQIGQLKEDLDRLK